MRSAHETAVDDAWIDVMGGIRELERLGAQTELVLACSIALRKADMRRAPWRGDHVLKADLLWTRKQLDVLVRRVFARR